MNRSEVCCMTDSTTYYDEHADRFIASADSADMGPLHEDFLSHVGFPARLLDAGCGSGRDSLAFSKLGYEVEAFDASKAMVEAASRLTGLPVRQLRFQQMDYQERFDGIWACASLIHVPRDEMDHVFKLLAQALKPAGILYCSFKSRSADYMDGGRAFTCHTLASLQDFIRKTGRFEIVRIYPTYDKRPDRAHETWVNAVARKL